MSSATKPVEQKARELLAISKRKAFLTVVAMVALVGYTKLIWQSGFDQGSDVTMCVIASIQNEGHLAKDDVGCRGAEAYKSNPLWLLRRRASNQETGR
jgi:hypothetical protein